LELEASKSFSRKALNITTISLVSMRLCQPPDPSTSPKFAKRRTH
jgi:hypothetical protein